MTVLLWLGGNGAFNTPSRWNDLFGSNPSTIAPDADDFAIVTGTAGQIITGPGTAGFLEVLASTTFDGAFSAVGINETGATGDYLTTFQIRNNATATFGSGATLNVTNENALIGHQQAGHLVLQGGADMSVDVTEISAAMYIGGETASGSTATVTGSGTTLTTDTGITVGLLTNATMTVSSSALLTMGGENSFGFYVGYGGGAAATFNLTGAADVVNTGFTTIGTLTGSAGTALVDGSGTTWQDVSISIGHGGTGVLTVQNQASVSAQSVSVGMLASGSGTLTVQGAGSILTATNDLAVGGGLSDGGTGTMTVQSSGTVNVANAMRLWGDGTLAILTNGIVNVGGAAGPVTGNLNIGATGLVEGTGTINAPVVNGGTLQATDFDTALADTTLRVNGNITGTGTIKLQGDATLEIIGTVAATQTVLFDDIFTGSDPTLSILAAGAAGFGATIDGFEAGDRIRLTSTLGAQALFDAVTNILTIRDFTGVDVATLKLTDVNDADSFVAFTDGANGTYVKIDDGTNTGGPTITSGGGGATASLSASDDFGFESYVLAATDPDNDTVSYRIVGGADKALFEVADADGMFFELKSRGVLDFENPQDQNGDNVYEVLVAAEDGRGGYDTQLVLITVANNPNPLVGTNAVDVLNGSADGETIIGLAGSDTLRGFSGNDILIGGRGRDTMTGGIGLDVFDFNALKETGKTAATRDRILDFVHLQDDIDLSTIDAKSGVSGNQAFKFIGTQAFHHVKGELHVTKINLSGTANDKTIVEGDVNGDGRADFQIELKGLIGLTKADFIL